MEKLLILYFVTLIVASTDISLRNQVFSITSNTARLADHSLLLSTSTPFILIAHQHSPLPQSSIRHLIPNIPTPLIPLPTNSFLFYSNKALAQLVADLPSVDWVGALQTKHKLHPNIAARSNEYLLNQLIISMFPLQSEELDPFKDSIMAFPMFSQLRRNAFFENLQKKIEANGLNSSNVGFEFVSQHRFITKFAEAEAEGGICLYSLKSAVLIIFIFRNIVSDCKYNCF